jgi:ribosomal protein L21E
MAKFSVGQRVEIAFNPPTPDPRVPNQVNGKFPGRGEYKTSPDFGEILADMGDGYLVAVELVAVHGKRKVKSVRQRVIPEAKLRAVS